MKTEYDFIFGLGRACACSQSLRLANLQLLSMPWDWIGIFPKPNGPDILHRIAIIESGFKGWLQEEDLEFVSHVAANGKDQYRNKRFNIIYPHDFPRDIPLHQSFPIVKAKYDRRISRFSRLLAKAKRNVLVVYMDAPTGPKTDVDTCREAQRRLQALYPHVKVDFLMFTLDFGRSFENRLIEDLGDGFTHVSFDYKDYTPGKPDYAVLLERCAFVMKSLASVRDYRTRAEKKAIVARTRRQKMLEAGAKNACEYFFLRRRHEISRLKEFFRIALAMCRRRKYDHVLSLGMNCEPAFRFSLSWGFVDSTPFAWTSCKDLPTLCDALRDPASIGSEGFEWDVKNLMWRCLKTGLWFHGKLVVDFKDPVPPPDALESDKAELVQRLAYLNGKFTRVVSDDSTKALIMRVHSKIAMADDANSQIDAVQRALEERGARNYTLVVVIERSAHGRIAPARNRVVRTVKAFNPGNSVVKPKLGDPIGWKALFAEFTPAKILQKKHLFKFEKP